MGFTLIIEFIIVVVLVILSGFFSASEIAIVAVRTSRLKELVAEGHKKAIFVERLKSNPDSFFAIVQIGMTVTASAASAIAGALAITLIGPLIATIPVKAIQTAAKPISVTLVVIVISYLFLVIAELVPKALAIRKTEAIALWVGPLTWYSIKALNVIIKILTWSTNSCLKLIGMSPEVRPGSAVSEAEVEFLIKEGLEHGVFNKEEQRLIHSVFEFTDTTVRRAMTPRTEILAVESNATPEELLRLATETRYSRFPVYEENLDNIKGIIHSKDLLYVYTHKGLFVLADIIRPAHFVPDSKKISELLHDMQKKKYQMAIVLDEFGGTAGIITVEDVVEEIVGDIHDEYDQESSKIVFLDNGRARVKASMPVDEFANEFGVEVGEGEFHTVSGLVVTKLGAIPAINTKVVFKDFTLTVLDKDGHKITKLLAEKIKDKFGLSENKA
jgi:putative hemolysin